MRTFKHRWLAALLWACVIFATSCTFISRRVFINFVKRFLPPGVSQNLWIGFWNSCGLLVVKLYHVMEFAFLCTLLFLSLHGKLRSSSRAIALSALLCAIYAATDEWHQTFVPGRGGTWVDVTIDCAGIGIASAFLWRRHRI